MWSVMRPVQGRVMACIGFESLSPDRYDESFLHKDIATAAVSQHSIFSAGADRYQPGIAGSAGGACRSVAPSK